MNVGVDGRGVFMGDMCVWMAVVCVSDECRRCGFYG